MRGKQLGKLSATDCLVVDAGSNSSASSVLRLAQGQLQVIVADIPTSEGQDQVLVIDVAGVEAVILTSSKVITQGAAYLWPATTLDGGLTAGKGKGPDTAQLQEGGFVKLELHSESPEDRELFVSRHCMTIKRRHA